jgi:hypothetical protein
MVEKCGQPTLFSEAAWKRVLAARTHSHRGCNSASVVVVFLTYRRIGAAELRTNRRAMMTQPPPN